MYVTLQYAELSCYNDQKFSEVQCTCLVKLSKSMGMTQYKQNCTAQ